MTSPHAQEVRQRLDAAGVFWMYEGDPRRDAPHALLTSNKHSNGYVDVGKVLKEQPETRKTFARFILDLVGTNFDWVVGADTSSTALAKDIAKLAGAGHIRMVKTEDKNGNKRQVWSPENASLHSYDLILHIEELITTSFSAFQVREGIRRTYPIGPGSFFPYLPVVVERSDPDNRVVRVEDSIVLPLLQLNIRNFEPNPRTCPYCAVGSEAIKPKESDNWARLTGKV